MPTAQETYLHDLTGQPLPPDLVKKGRKVELDYFHDKGVWTKRPYAEAKRVTGKPPISVRWVDTNKGDNECPNVRCRLVARQIRRHGEEAIFAPTPPLEALRTVLSIAITTFGDDPERDRDPNSEERFQVSFVDISRAYFNAKCDPEKPTYVELPPEDPDHGRMCGLLQRHMYGTRAAADGWQQEYARTLTEDLGFEQGAASPCIFVHKTRNLTCSVHGDDFTFLSIDESLNCIQKRIQEHYEVKIRGRLGPHPKDD